VNPLVYLDHAATTPVRAEAVAAMLPLLTEGYANPSGSHRFARQARQVVDEARDDVAAALGVTAGEVVFTGCGTESDNTAITGTLRGRSGPGVVVCPAVEHHAVLHPVEHLGGSVIGVDPAGHVDLDQLESAIGPETAVVSVMAVNNEVGTVTDLAAVAEVVRRRAPDALVHTDAIQAASWLDLRSITPLVDLLSLSAHKFGGPKGVGVLVVRDGVRIDPLLRGGGQERDRRSGTHNVAGIVATSVALALTDAERAEENVRIRALRDRLVDGLIREVDGVVETVPRDRKVAGSAHVCVAGVESEALLYLLDTAGVCASAASACSSGALQVSHVLAAMGVAPELARGALRLSLGHTTTAADVDRAIDVLADAVRRVRTVVAAR
jgi:cysteine desulfurase